MRRLASLLLLLPLAALAQGPQGLDLSGGGLSASSALSGLGAPRMDINTNWIAQDTPSTRFPTGDTPGPELTKGQKVRVVYRDVQAERTRIMVDNTFAWVPNAALSPFDTSMSTMGGDFDLESLLQGAGAGAE